MAQSEVHSNTSVPATSLTVVKPRVKERNLRRTSAWLLLLFLLQGELGAVWDREWHAYVGRDQFWTPPHTLIYTCVAGAGILALIVVLWETYRYRHHVPAVDATSTVPIFRFFHAPLGFSVLGFGALLALIAAPLDNYWHELYGIDIALWAPFHMMGVTGGLIGMLGMVYVFASEAAIERQSKQAPRRYFGLTLLEIGIVMTMASVLNYVLTGFLQFPLISLGTIQVSTYPLPLIAGCIMFMIAVNRTTQRPGTATLLALLLLLHTIVVELFVPWAIRFSVAQQGIPYRNPNSTPSFSLAYALLPSAFILSALIIDFATYRQKQRTGHPDLATPKNFIVGIISTIPIIILTPLILLSYTQYALIVLPGQGIPIIPIQIGSIVSVAIIVMLGMGAFGAWLGGDFGDVWHWSKR